MCPVTWLIDSFGKRVTASRYQIINKLLETLILRNFLPCI